MSLVGQSLLSRSDGAALLLALTSSDEKKAFVSAALARKGLINVSGKYVGQVEKLWSQRTRKPLLT